MPGGLVTPGASAAGPAGAVGGGPGGGPGGPMSAMWSILHAYQYANFTPFPFPPRMASFEDSNSMESHHFRPMEHSPTDGYGCGKARKNKEDKYCGVCGDRALGYNFDAISCESCKAFFRRNAPKGLDYFKCPYEEKCKMDVSNRRFCKRCRLRKCFEIGMRKEYILTEEEKMRKRMRIEENRTRLKQQPATSMDRRFRDMEKTKMQIGDVTSSQVRLRPLEPEEDMAINEVVSAYHQSLEICVESDISREKASMIDVVNIAEISVRRVIDMSKKIKSFKALSQADQIGLLKGGSIELLIIRSVITFDKDKQQFKDPYDKDKYAMTTEQFKMATDTAAAAAASPAAEGENMDMGGMGLFEDHMRFVKSLALDLQADETMLILLLMIALYSPDRPAITDKSYIAKEQEHYALLLLRYLESKYPQHVVRILYPKLLMKLVDIRNLNEEHSQVLLRINPDGLQPLMKEVLEHNLDRKPSEAGSTPTSPIDGSPSTPTRAVGGGGGGGGGSGVGGSNGGGGGGGGHQAPPRVLPPGPHPPTMPPSAVHGGPSPVPGGAGGGGGSSSPDAMSLPSTPPSAVSSPPHFMPQPAHASHPQQHPPPMMTTPSLPTRQ